jgi:protein KRI1
MSVTRSPKRVKLLSDDESDNSDSDNSGGVKLNGQSASLSINEEYARRFEHNQKRAELHRLQDKYGTSKFGRATGEDSGDSDDDDDSTSVSEDDDGFLATGALDEDYTATLRAIRNKDPRIYDKNSKFYNEDDVAILEEKEKKEKPMYLSDYHRQNILNGGSGLEEDTQLPYVQQQEALKQSLVKEIHAVGADIDHGSDAEDSSGEGDIFTIKKPVTLPERRNTILRAEIEQADKNPEEFLSRYLDSRAWVPNSASKWEAFESDDESEDLRAEEFEQAYNLRFENPEGANEKLISHARDTATKYSVRDEPKSKRQRHRETEKIRKEEAKAEKTQEKARLRKLRLEEVEQKLGKIKEAAGSRNLGVKLDDWSEFLTEDWDDTKWEEQMKLKFGDDYYAEADNESIDGEEVKRKKVHKPKWDDELDIMDIIPTFENEEKATFSLSDDDGDDEEKLRKKKHKEAREAEKREARKEKRKLDQLVDEQVNLDLALKSTNNKTATTFRYRETSPLSWGLTPRDILMASDSQLNEFAGLKKIASFRDAEKRKRDKKRLGKKARLRQWRKDTFGNEQGPQKSLQDLIQEAYKDEGTTDQKGPKSTTAEGQTNGSGKRRRSKKKSASTAT